MNTGLWLVAGCLVAWLGYSTLKLNLSRGLLVSLVIGAIGAYFGGSVIAPLFASGALVADDFNLFALFLAAAIAAAALVVSDMVYERFGF